MATVAFIGLGNMGGPMAANLIKAGHQLAVFDLVAQACDVLAAQGARVASSPLDAARDAEVVITMLPAGKHVAGVYLGDEGLLAKLSGAALLLDCSTIDVATARAVGEAAQQQSLAFMDTPVSGGVAAAAAGTLTFMCGGPAEHFERAKAVLAGMGRNIFHAGPPGAGQVAKCCNNMLLAIHMIGTTEALEMGVRGGLDPKVLSEIMLASSGRNWSLEVYNPYPGVMEKAPASNDYKPGFMVDLMLKDLRLALELAESQRLDNALGQLAHNRYAEHQSAGNGSRDFSSILELLQR
jgi:3-hydroxyisobutyrate dehydrogenase